MTYVGRHYSRLPGQPGGAPLSTNERWFVMRHGGNSNHRWRVVTTSSQRSPSEARFVCVAEALKVGAVALVDPEGVVQRYAPPIPNAEPRDRDTKPANRLTPWNAKCRRENRCLQCPNPPGPTSSVRCDPCHFKKLAKERATWRDRRRKKEQAG